MKVFYKNNKKPDLCLVFCGWGTDERLYEPVLKDMDYLLYYDYDKELKFDIPVDLKNYDKVYLLSYSAGGFIPVLLKEQLPKFDMKVGVNASTKIDGEYGLTGKAYEAMKNINTENFMQFRIDFLIETKEELFQFCKNQPRRSFQSCQEELDNLFYLSAKIDVYNYDFDRIYHSENDKIIPYEVQKMFFGDKIIKIKGAHFPFYKYGSLKEFFV